MRKETTGTNRDNTERFVEVSLVAKCKVKLCTSIWWDLWYFFFSSAPFEM